MLVGERNCIAFSFCVCVFFCFCFVLSGFFYITVTSNFPLLLICKFLKQYKNSEIKKTLKTFAS